jgi:hypothetical protein
VECHNPDTPEGELDLGTLGSLETFDQNMGSMQRILEMVRFGAMPPEDAEQPSDEQRQRLVTELDRSLYATSCDQRPRAGKVAARRLNRAEYNHTIRDLFGIDIQPANDFPSDEVGAGFDNNGDVLSLSPILMEKYLEAAEMVADQVVQDPTQWPQVEQIVGGENLFVVGDARLDSAGGWFLTPESFLWVDLDVPASGRYRLAIRGGRGLDDGQKTTFAIYDDSGLLLGTHQLKYFGGKQRSVRSEKRLELKKGKVRLFFQAVETPTDELIVGETVSELFANLNDDIVTAAIAQQGEQHERLAEIDSAAYPWLMRQIELRGPTDYAPDAFSEAHNRTVIRAAKQTGDRWQFVPESARDCLRPLLRRAFRGPVADDEVQPYIDLVAEVVQRGESYYRGLQVAITAMLVSPRFLFRIETPPPTDDAVVSDQPKPDGSSVQSVALTQHQLATRLSYFLWASMPDEELLTAADNGELVGEGIDDQVLRMIADPKAEALATQFAAQWLGLRNLDEHEPDLEKFAAFTPSLRESMKRETELLFLHMVRENRPIRELIQSDYTFLNRELAAYYGVPNIDQDEFEQVSLGSAPRRGVLTHASVLTLTSNPGRTSPVKRGKWILENILGSPPPDPPPGVPELEATEAANAAASLREQLDLHRTNPTCASCHKVMDQLGFGLEQFDAIGGFRELERKRPIDASGALPGGRTFNGAIELSEILATSESTAFAGVVVERLMTYALGRELSPADRCTVAEIVTQTTANENRWIDLILEVIRSRQFQYYDE